MTHNNQDYYKGDRRIQITENVPWVVLPNGNLSDGYITVKKRPWNALKECYENWVTIVENKHNLLTNGGRDFFHAQVYTNSAAGTRGSNYLGVTNTASFTPAAGDTTMSGELAANGFTRADASAGATHTAGTNSTAITKTFTDVTANQTGIQGSGLFNASSAGTLTHEAAFTSTDLVINDQLQVTWTLNLG